MKKILIIMILGLSAVLMAQRPNPQEILRAIDRNMISNTSRSTTTMVIHGRRNSRTVSSVNYSRGTSDFFTEYTAPPRDRGTKMLKLGDDLWIYEPSAQRTVQISGNMLRQSVMGSDLSYEDFMEENSLVSTYTAQIEGEINHNGRSCWNMLLTARSDNVPYHSRRLYVDKERNIPLYQEWNAKSGRLLKTIEATDVARIGGRWYPRKVVFKDALKQGRGTEYIVESIEFDVSIPSSVFSRSQLSN